MEAQQVLAQCISSARAASVPSAEVVSELMKFVTQQRTPVATPPPPPKFQHKPKQPAVFDPDKSDFVVWRDSCEIYFAQVVCNNVPYALLDFLAPTPAAELRELIGGTTQTLSLKECFDHIQSVCVSHTRAEMVRRNLLSVTADTHHGLVTRFWKTYDAIPLDQRPDVTWVWTILLFLCGVGDHAELEKELRKEIRTRLAEVCPLLH